MAALLMRSGLRRVCRRALVDIQAHHGINSVSVFIVIVPLEAWA